MVSEFAIEHKAVSPRSPLSKTSGVWVPLPTNSVPGPIEVRLGWVCRSIGVKN
jgi:hypothetical protein